MPVWETSGQDLWGLLVNYVIVYWYCIIADILLSAGSLTHRRDQIEIDPKHHGGEIGIKINIMF